MAKIKSIDRIYLCGSEKCSGCGACFNICPCKAISMQENEEGFLYPCIDETKCTKCGLCRKICPVIHTNFSNSKNPDCYAAIAEDKLRKNSSSGAVFPVLAQNILDNGGYVCGAAYADDFSVEHIIVDNKNTLEKLKGSKYLQSNTKDCFSKIKDILKTGKKVLFTGCPCQVAGLKSFLQKDYENLFCADLICHGTPSAKIFQKYLKETFPNEKIEEYTFRDKSQGWHTFYSKIKSDINQHHVHMTDNSYFKGFLYNIFLRESCYKCPFATIPRQGDITIGDFWGIENYDITLDDNKGTSVVLINNQKGKDFFEKIKNKFKICKQMPLKNAINHNPTLKNPLPKHPQKYRFIRDFDKYTLNKNIEYCLTDKADVGIINFFNGLNYGAVITAWALQEAVEQLGFVSRIINFGTDATNYDNYSYRFRQKYLNLTTKVKYDSEFEMLNDKIHTFITGSDQVFRKIYADKNYDKYLLDFVLPQNKKIAFSASFGVEPYDIPNELNETDILNYKTLLKSFDFVSTREDSGVEICKKYFDTDAQWVTDPVFMLEPAKYAQLINNYSENIGDKYKDKIVTYILNNNPVIEKGIEYISAKLNKPVVNIYAEKGDIDIEEWLAAIKNASYIITNSFHGCCFSLIFNKPFLCVRNAQKGNARFNALFKKFEIPQVILDDIERVYTLDNIFSDINYEKVNKIMEEEKIKNTKLLYDLISSPKIFDAEKTAYSQTIMNKQNNTYLNILNNKGKILRKYYFYKIVQNFCFGKRRKKINKKRIKLKETIQKYSLI